MVFLKSIKYSIILNCVLILFMVSCGRERNIVIDGIEGPYIYINENRLIVSMEMKSINYSEETEVTYYLPKFTDSFVETSKGNNNGTVLTFSFDLSELLTFDDSMFKSINLPGDRKIPNVFGGILPGTIFSIKDFSQMAMYIAPTHMGLFIPFPDINIEESIFSFNYYLGTQQRGSISLVGSNDKSNAGIFLLLNYSETSMEEFLTSVQ